MHPERHPLFEVRPSPVHGLGAFALRRIRRGTRVAEYVGERLTGGEVDARYADEEEGGHTFLFRVGDDAYIDASRQGNDSRFINHSCEPNCEVDVADGRIYITAIRNISPGAELTYDYALELEELPPAWERHYACRCASARCRGTMLEPRPSERAAPESPPLRRGGHA
jgi:SET domain-containing protein